ncbi:MAG: PAS domain S-box protein [Deltaproteobacteria bacterium]|nr:PAS domain S-box protein [Deltaproteobacteria bacterium]
MSEKQQNFGQTPADAAALRKRAEEQARTMELTALSAQTPEEIRQMLHELQVHRIELEMQNEELRAAQAELDASRARYFDLYDLAPAGYCTLNEQGLILEANLTAATLLSVNRGALVKQALSRFILKEDQDLYYRHRQQLFKTGQPQVCELRMVKQDGAECWTRLDATTAQDEDGAPYSRVVMTDITEHKQAESALRLKDFVFHASITANSIVDAKGVITEVNAAFVRTGAYRHKDEVVGRPIAEFFQNEAEAAAFVTGLYTTGEWAGEYTAKRKDGSTFVALGLATLLRDEASEIIGYQSAVIDITERKQAEERLKASEEYLDRIINAIGDPVFVKDERFQFVLANDALCALLGKARDELLGTTGVEFLPPDQMDHFLEVDRKVLSSGQENLCEEALTAGDGSIRTIVTRKRRYVDGHGARFVVGVIRDITEQKQAEEERENLQAQFIQAQKMESVGRLAGGVAHDFNNKLTVIIGYAQMAMEGLDTDAPLYGNLQQVLKAGRQSTDIVRQLLAFARKQIIAPEVLDLNEALEEMLKMLRRLIGEDIDLGWEPATDLWQVNMDPTQIDQILANLCVNARDAISGVGKVTIETENVVLDESYCADHAGFVPGEYVMLAVSDDGIGMDRETLAHAFEPFFTTKEVGKGTGLGLPTVYGIVKQNNGFVNIYSEPGKGTCFKVYLPRHHGKAEKAIEASQTEIPRGRGETVLIVEDDAPVLHLARRVLEKMGYAVLTSATPAEAVAMVREYDGEIHLLMTDVVLPGMSGKDLAGRYPRYSPTSRPFTCPAIPPMSSPTRGCWMKGCISWESPLRRTAWPGR